MTALLSTIITISNTYSMEKPEDLNPILTRQNGHIDQPLILPNMIAISENIEGHNTRLKIFGQDHAPIFDMILPSTDYVLKTILEKDGSLLIHAACTVYGTESYILKVKDGNVSKLMYGLTKIYGVTIARDETVYILGEAVKKHGDEFISGNFIVTVKDGKVSEPQNYGLKIMLTDKLFHMASDGTLIIPVKEAQTIQSIATMKDGKTSEPQNYGFNYVRKVTTAPDATFLVLGEYKTTITSNNFVTVKEGIISKPQTYGFYYIDTVTAGADGVFYVIGKKDKDGDYCIVRVKDEKTSEPESYGLMRINCIIVTPEGTAFIQGQDSEGINKVITVKDEKKSEFFQSKSHLSMTQIMGNSFKDIFHNKKEEIFSPKDGINIGALEALCTDIQTFHTSAVSHVEGKVFYDFFLPHILDLQQDSDAFSIVHKLLDTLAPHKNAPLYGYVLATNFEGEAFEEEIFLLDNNMSKDSLIAQKEKESFNKRLQRTKEAKKMLEAIELHTLLDLHQHYRRLLGKINAALTIFEDTSKSS